MTDPIAPPPQPRMASTPSLLVPIVILVGIAALYLGRDIFVPLVLAILLTFALAPVVRAIEALKLPHVAAVLLATSGAVLVIGLIAYLIVTQLIALAGELANYQQIVGAKLRALQQTTENGGILSRIADAIDSVGSATEAPATVEPGQQQPVPVTLVNAGRGPLDYVFGALESVLGPLASAAIVIVFVIFLLLERADFRDRFLKLVSRGDLRTSTKVMNEAAKRVGRYLLVQFGVNVANGVIFGVGLQLIHIPNALLWGLLAALFRYIPFVGTLIAAAIPFALAFAIDPGWTMLIQVVVLYSVLEMAITNGVEPRLYGSSTGLSALAVLVAAIFWATLWGPIGLILATPMTVCLVVVGRYVPQLQFLEILLGSEPVLVREEQLYQRLLSGNIEEAVELAEAHLADGRSPQSFYDEIAVPALRLAEADRQRNLTDLSVRRLVVDGMAAVAHEIEHIATERDEVPDDTQASGEWVASPRPIDVLCIGGRSEIDAAAADMIVQVLSRPGIGARTLPPLSVRQNAAGSLDLADADVVCLVYLGDNPRSFARFVTRQLKRRMSKLQVIACVLSTLPGSAADLQSEIGADAVATSIAGVEKQVLAWRQAATTQAIGASPAAAGDERARAEVVVRGRWLEPITARIATALNVQVAMVSILPAAPMDGSAEVDGKAADILSLARLVAEEATTLVITDVAGDERFAEDPFLLENGARFYAGAPIVLSSGAIVGALSVLDHEPREFSADQSALLAAEAGRISDELDRRLAAEAAAA